MAHSTKPQENTYNIQFEALYIVLSISDTASYTKPLYSYHLHNPPLFIILDSEFSPTNSLSSEK